MLSRAGELDEAGFMQSLPRLGPGAAGQATGDAIGPYRLLREIGNGGMGAVWLAERTDGALQRQVALKLPRMAWAPGMAERMARERDILASLEHPHIARLYDAGLDRLGRPYLALEYVEGQTIDAYAHERRLAVRQRVPLLPQVCSAVAFAHSRLVVHRDLKPGNILVTPEGEVSLLDFGIAKLLTGDLAAETRLTQLAGHALTLHYASPEQIRGEPISTASDVYSLGVVAYELLTGTSPYRLKRGSAAELEEAITTADPPRASDAATDPAARKALKGDLDAILNKALQKSARERYVSVQALAQMREVLRDMRQHLGERDPSFLDALDDFGSFLNQAGRPTEARGVLVEALAARVAVYGPEHPTLTAVYGYLGHGWVRSGRPLEAVPLLQRSIALETAGNPRPTPYIAFQQEWLFRAHLRAGGTERAERAFAAGLRALRESGEAPRAQTFLRLHATHALEHLVAGRPQAARVHAERLGELARHHGALRGGPLLAQLLSLAAPVAGGRAEAASRLARLDALLQEAPDANLRTAVRLTQARLHRELGDLAAAVAAYDAAMPASPGGDAACRPELLPAGLEWAEALLRLDRGAEAKSLLARLAPCANAQHETSPARRRWQQLAAP